MEHLMTREELEEFKNEIPVVPWLGGDHDATEEREAGPLIDYPCARGWTVEESCDPCGVLKSDPDKALPMLQSWLLFGILEGATMHKFASRLPKEMSDDGYRGFRMPGPGGEIICFNPLNGLRKAWNYFLEATQHSEAERQLSLRRTMSDASRIIEGLTELRDRGTLEEETIPLSMLDSIVKCAVLLLEMVANCAPQCLTVGQGLVSLRTNMPGTVWRQVRARYRKNGWCPSTPNKLHFKFGSCSLLEYASYFQATDQPSSKHLLCDKDRCTANNVDIEHCQASHVSPECQCRFIRPSLDDIRQILESGGLPVLTFGLKVSRQLANGVLVYSIGTEFGINVTRHFSTCKLLAVSHVWSDGLIGTTETGLPECQIRKIHGLMRSLEMDYFWIDALAIPSEPELRKIAITRMSQVYSLADRTLILDKGLQRLEPPRDSRGPLLLRVSTSAWLQRLWTFQEVALSKNPYIMFRDGLVPLDQFHSEWRKHRDETPGPISLAFLKEFTQIRGGRYRSLMTVGRLSQILSGRDSSHKDDETLAIASLLNVNVSSLLEVSGEERMKVFWLQLAQIPRDIISTSHPRMRLEGFRALPRTMLGVQSQQPLSISNTDPARVTGLGLRATYWIYDFDDVVAMGPGFRGFFYDMEHDWMLQILRFERDACDKSGFDAIVMVNEITPSNFVSFGAALLKTGEMQGEVPVYRFLGRVEASLREHGVAVQGTFPPETLSEFRAFTSYQEEIIIT